MAKCLTLIREGHEVKIPRSKLIELRLFDEDPGLLGRRSYEVESEVASDSLDVFARVVQGLEYEINKSNYSDLIKLRNEFGLDDADFEERLSKFVDLPVNKLDLLERLARYEGELRDVQRELGDVKGQYREQERELRDVKEQCRRQERMIYNMEHVQRASSEEHDKVKSELVNIMKQFEASEERLIAREKHEEERERLERVAREKERKESEAKERKQRAAREKQEEQERREREEMRQQIEHLKGVIEVKEREEKKSPARMTPAERASLEYGKIVVERPRPTGGNRFDGFMSWLKSKNGRNAHEAGVIVITASNSMNWGQVSQVIDDSQKYWGVNAMTNASLTFDLKSYFICLDGYSIRSCNQGKDWYHLRSWKIEGSNDSVSWTRLDHRVTDELNDKSVERTFSCNEASNEFFRYLKLTQTGKNCYGDDLLTLATIEFFGTVRSKE